MSDEVVAASAPSRHRAPRALGLGVGLIVVGVAAGAVIVTHSHRSVPPGSGSARHAVAAAASAPGSVASGLPPVVAVRSVLARRSRAILHHDRSALLATIDPSRHRFAAGQARMLANLSRVPIAGWSYTVDPAPQPAAQGSSSVPTFMAPVSLHYRLRGFDRTATDLRQYATFTERSHRWYLASLSGRATAGRVSARDLWDYGPVDVVRRPHVLVLGPPSMLGTMRQVAVGLHEAIPRVTAIWGPRWPRRVVAEVPATQHELAQITGDHEDLAPLAALSSAEISSSPGHPSPVGDRVSVNPRVWPSLDALGRRVVLTHELTHVASRADTGVQTPRWLQEGFADYVGFAGTGVATRVIAAELARDVRAGRLPRRLPGDRGFAGSSPRLAQAYQQGWLACRLIAARAGQSGLVRFYRSVGTSTASAGPAVDHALRQVMHMSTQQFTALWRGYVRQQLG